MLYGCTQIGFSTIHSRTHWTFGHVLYRKLNNFWLYIISNFNEWINDVFSLYMYFISFSKWTREKCVYDMEMNGNVKIIQIITRVKKEETNLNYNNNKTAKHTILKRNEMKLEEENNKIKLIQQYFYCTSRYI